MTGIIVCIVGCTIYGLLLYWAIKNSIQRQKKREQLETIDKKIDSYYHAACEVFDWLELNLQHKDCVKEQLVYFKKKHKEEIDRYNQTKKDLNL